MTLVQEVEEWRQCGRCGEYKPVSAFPPGNHSGGKGRPRRVYAYCRPCHSAYQRVNRLRNEFDLTVEDYDRIVATQGGTCGLSVCDRTTSHGEIRLAVDHDHRSGLVRGALCTYHNRMLGHMTPELVAALNNYMQDPPAVRALGERFTTPGRVGTKKRRKARRERA